MSLLLRYLFILLCICTTFIYLGDDFIPEELKQFDKEPMFVIYNASLLDN